MGTIKVSMDGLVAGFTNHVFPYCRARKETGAS